MCAESLGLSESDSELLPVSYQAFKLSSRLVTVIEFNLASWAGPGPGRPRSRSELLQASKVVKRRVAVCVTVCVLSHSDSDFPNPTRSYCQ